MAQDVTVHYHEWVDRIESDNDDRTRSAEMCACGLARYGVKAKRLDALGEPAWGPVDGEWHYTYATHTDTSVAYRSSRQ